MIKNRNGNKFLKWTLLICFFSITFSCKYSNSPESVVKKFLVSFNRLDFTTAKSLSSKGTWEILDIMAAYTKEVSDEKKIELSKDFTVKITKVEQESDSTVIVYFKTNPKRLPFDHLRLYKTLNKNEEVRWKIDISTLDLMNTEENENEFIPDDISPDDIPADDSTKIQE